MKISKIYPRDIIALVTLIACFILIASGLNHVISGIAIMIITYYFSKRMYEEKHPNGDMEKKVEKLEKKINLQPLQPQIPQNASVPNQLGPPVVVKPFIPAE